MHRTQRSRYLCWAAWAPYAFPPAHLELHSTADLQVTDPRWVTLGGEHSERSSLAAQVGSGLRTYLPRVSSRKYKFTCVDLPGADDKAPLNGVGTDLEAEKHYGDILKQPELLTKLVPGKDIVIYLARRNDLEEMNAMTDLVFETCLAQPKPPFMLSASSIHAIDGAYSVDRGVLSLLSERRFSEIEGGWPAKGFPIPATTASVGDRPYTVEKRHAEKWCQKYAAAGHGAIAARWGGINPVKCVQQLDAIASRVSFADPPLLLL